MSPSQTTSLCHIQSVFVRDSLCLLQTICVCQRQSVSVTDSLCLSQTICVCHRQSVSVTDTLLDHSWPGFLLIYTCFSPRFVHEILICPAFKHHQHQLCGPLGGRWTFSQNVSSQALTVWELEVTPDMLHLTPDTWHVIGDIWHVSFDTQGMVNIVSRFQVPSSNGLAFIMF